MLESFFKKLAGFQASHFIEKSPTQQVFSGKYYKILKNIWERLLLSLDVF